MGAFASCTHQSTYEKERFSHMVDILKSYEANPTTSDKYIPSVERCYSEDFIQTDHLNLDRIHDDIEKVIDAAKYFLTHFKTALHRDDIKQQCNKSTHCEWHPVDSMKQLHFILYHTSDFEHTRRQRMSRFTQEWTHNRPLKTENHNVISETDEKHNKSYKPIPYLKQLPRTPPNIKTKQRSSSVGYMTKKRVMHLHQDIANHNINPNNDIPPIAILTSCTSAQSDHYDELSPSDRISPKPQNMQHLRSPTVKKHQIKPQPISTEWTPPKRIKRQRSKTFSGTSYSPSRVNNNTPLAEHKPTTVCIGGSADACPYMKVFLSQHQGKRLLDDYKDNNMDDALPPGTVLKTGNSKYGVQHQHYAHCFKYHSAYKGECNAGTECIWDSENDSELYEVHGHFFHNVVMKVGIAPKVKLVEERRQRFSIASKVRYKITLNSLQKNEKYSGMKQLEFGYKYEITQASHARFRNPKEEILHNTYSALGKKEWNDLLKRSVYYFKRTEAKRIPLSMKDTVSLKLYTDFDVLQRAFRVCFREKHRNERIKRQKSFYYWYKQLVFVTNKSKHIVPSKLYHGVDVDLPPSTFFGNYYGPVSTTTNWDIAVGFAGKQGQVIELYPSFGKRGLNVSFLSNFPDEKEVLYMDCSFQISNIYKRDACGQLRLDQPLILNHTEQSSVFGVESVTFVESTVLKAMQMISVNSQVISLNYTYNGQSTGFSALECAEKISVLYLLYLEYRVDEWKTFLNTNSAPYVRVALAKYRDTFVSLATNVKAVRMEKLSKLLQIFFYTKQKEYKFPFSSGFKYKENDIASAEESFKPKQPLCLETICLLFPNAEQISINADNWDFSLNTFIGFLEIFDLDFANVALQDIYIRFVDDNGKIMNIDRRARGRRKDHNDFKRNMQRLRKLGWAFVTASHLHRVGFEPLPELPFLRLFVPPQKSLLPPVLFQTYSSRFSIASYLSSFDLSRLDVDHKDKEGIEVGEHDDANGVVLVDHNPKNCILSKDIFCNLQYKLKLIELLQWRRDDPSGVCSTKERQNVFKRCCDKVRVVVIDPIPKELEEIFYQTNTRKTKVVSFSKICDIFPNVEDIFLRNTTFNLKLCWDFIRFISNIKNNYKSVKLQRVFFSKDKPMKYRDSMQMDNIKTELNDINWDFAQNEQTVFNRCYTINNDNDH